MRRQRLYKNTKVQFEGTAVGFSTFALMVGLIFLFSACGPGIQTNKNIGKSSGCINCSNPDPQDPIEKLDIDATMNVGPLVNHKVIELDKVNNMVIMSIPLPLNPLGGAISYDIPELPGAYVEITDRSGDWAIEVHMPLVYIVRGVEFADPARLPNGRALPGVPGGELPRLGLKLTRGDDLYLYLGAGAFAIYYPYERYTLPFSYTYEIKNDSGRKTIGFFSIVGASGGASGGLYLSLVFPPEIARAIDDILP